MSWYQYKLHLSNSIPNVYLPFQIVNVDCRSNAMLHDGTIEEVLIVVQRGGLNSRYLHLFSASRDNILFILIHGLGQSLFTRFDGHHGMNKALTVSNGVVCPLSSVCSKISILLEDLGDTYERSCCGRHLQTMSPYPLGCPNPILVPRS